MHLGERHIIETTAVTIVKTGPMYREILLWDCLPAYVQRIDTNRERYTI